MKTIITLILCTLLISCADERLDNSNPSIQSDNFTEVSFANKEFSKGLALAVSNPDIRQFLKTEALKEIDKDFDVIYSLVKDRTLKSGQTFREELAKYMGGIERLDAITKQSPTLTILVPHLGDMFNPYNWDIENQIPNITYREYGISKEQKQLPTFDKIGNSFFIPRYENPTTPTLVVKVNERLISPSDIRTRTSLNKELLTEDGELIAYFSDNEFCNSNASTRSLANNNIYDYVTPILEDRIFRSISETPNSPRDYIYYGISTVNNIEKGELNTDYKEYITSMKFNNIGVLSHVEDRNDLSVTADWSDGNLEIVFDFLFLTKDDVLSKLTKMVSVRISDLVINETESVKTYFFKEPIEVFNWDMYKYGSTFKVIVSEYDPGTQTELTQSTSTVISHNWQVDTSGGFGKIWKVGAKYGGSYTQNKQNSTKINSTNNSDPLGEVFVDFFNPIYTSNQKKIDVITVLFNEAGGEEEDWRTFALKDREAIIAFINAKKEQFIKSGYASKYGLSYAISAPYFSDDPNDYYKSNTGMVSLSITPMKIN